MRWIVGIACVILLIFVSSFPMEAKAVVAPSSIEEQLQQGDELSEKALKAGEMGDFAKAEEYWTLLVDRFPDNPAAWSNRGNSRIAQHKLEEAIADFNKAIELAPDAPDPYLNRGIAFEGQERYREAIADYDRVLELDPEDPVAYNNRGNAEGGQGLWEKALRDYQKASELAPGFAFARANAALALYQLGNKTEALKEMRNLVRKYPMFPDIRAALSAVLWEEGKQGEAESNWVAAVGIDNRYQDIDWVKQIRRWPPQMVAALEKFLKLN